MSADESAAPWGEREPQYLESTSGWQQVTDPVSGSIYWWDPRTDETSWQAPQEVLDAEAGAESQQWDSADKGGESDIGDCNVDDMLLWATNLDVNDFG